LSTAIYFSFKGIYSQDSDNTVVSHTFAASVGHTDFQTDSLMLSFAFPPVLSPSPFFFLTLWELHSHETLTNAKHEKLFYGASVVQSLD